MKCMTVYQRDIDIRNNLFKYDQRILLKKKKPVLQ